MIKEKIYHIQNLRGIAACLVVFYHTLGSANAYGNKVNILSFLEGWGAGGVDLFFVISGFIMVYIQKVNPVKPIDFVINRLIRICPLYWLLSIFLFSLISLIPQAFNTTEMAFEWFLGSVFFLSQLLFDKPPILYDGWTLEFEMVFYLIFAFSLLVRKQSSSIILSSIVIMAWGILSKQYIVFEFLYGLIIGWLYVKDQNYFNYARLIFIVGIVFFCATTFSKQEYVGREIYLGIPSALIVYGSLGLRQYKIALLTSLGDASYSIYLVQIFTIAVYYKTLKFFLIPEVFNDVLALGCLFFTAVCGLILHATIEKTVSAYLFKFKRYL